VFACNWLPYHADIFKNQTQASWEGTNTDLGIAYDEGSLVVWWWYLTIDRLTKKIILSGASWSYWRIHETYNVLLKHMLESRSNKEFGEAYTVVIDKE
jgi:hypothetical protein